MAKKKAEETEPKEETETPETETPAIPQMAEQPKIVSRVIEKKIELIDIIESIFKERDENGNLMHPILVHTREETLDAVPDKVNFYKLYLEKIEQYQAIDPDLKVVGYSMINRAIRDLVERGVIIRLKDLIGAQNKSKFYTYSRAFKSFKPVFRKVGDLYEFVEDEGREDKIIGARTYILREGVDSNKLIETKMNSLLGLYVAEIAEEMAVVSELEETEESRRVQEMREKEQADQRDLESFGNQILKTEGFNFKNVYLGDLTNYLREMFYRKCPNLLCRKTILIPDQSKNPQSPIINLDKYEFFKELQQQYLLPIESAEVDQRHPFYLRPKKDKQNYLASLRSIKKQFTCPSCQTDIRKAMLIGVEDAIASWSLCIDRQQPAILFGYPGDGKSTIYHQILEYFEWRYGTPYMIYNMDETTTTSKLAGGYSPVSFGGIKEIRYGLLTKALLKRGWRDHLGNIIGLGANIMFDEINRTPFENISFLMGFLESPYTYVIEEDDSRKLFNPNHLRRKTGKEFRWVMLGTMNIQDIGNQPISSAFKSRFHIQQISYTKEKTFEVLNLLFRLTDYEKEIFNRLYESINAWQKAGDIQFPAGIRHYNGFFKFLRSALAQVVFEGSDLKIRDTDFSLELFIREILRSAIIMPIINETRRQVVETKEKQMETIARRFTEVIQTYLKNNNNDLATLETVDYFGDI